jgi:class 3 adenylate cyclase
LGLSRERCDPWLGRYLEGDEMDRSSGRTRTRHRLTGLVAELKRRRVFRVVLVYAGVAFLVWQVAAIAFPALGIPSWTLSLVVVLSVLGLPLAVVLAWAFDITREGVVRAEPARARPGASGGPAVRSARRSEEARAEPSDEARAHFALVQSAFEEALGIDESRRHAELERIVPDSEVRAEVLEMLEAHASGGMLDDLAESLEAGPEPGGAFPAVGSRFGPYTLVECLGSGGMGVVYRAEDSRLSRMVALKFLSPSLGADDRAKQRFLAEARAAAALDHPNICTILEVGEFDSQLFIAMPYYRGRTVKDLLEGGALGAALAVPVAIAVGRGLAAAHASGVIHRDVKPANVIVTESGTATIVDFGVAKIAQQNLTRTGVALGTVSYMSPEQTRGEAVDHRSDIWALGVMLYEMVAGVRPFRGSTDQDIEASIIALPHEPLGPHVDGAPGLEQVVDRALEKDPAQRWATATEMVRALERIRIGSEPDAGETGLRGGLMRKGERRQVTVLTALLAEFDELVDRLTPESLEVVLRQVRQAVTDAVTVDDGLVHAVNADRIECVFGIPEAHEDDAKRAVRAALEAGRRCERIPVGSTGEGLRIALRSGIDVGIVAVHLDPGDGGRYRFGRSLMERAARLASEADAGGVLVSSDCYRLVRSFVDTDPGPDVGLGHDSGTVSTYNIRHLRDVESSLEARASDGLTAFTGRASEIGVLAEGLSEAVSGSGGIVTVSGEAGIGKSRLLYEFERGVLGDRTRVLHGRCQSSANCWTSTSRIHLPPRSPVASRRWVESWCRTSRSACTLSPSSPTDRCLSTFPATSSGWPSSSPSPRFSPSRRPPGP